MQDGSGITPFLSMALAIADGTEDFELTPLYGSRTKKDILFWDVLDACQQRSNGKVKVVHVLSGEEYTFFNHEVKIVDTNPICKYNAYRAN